MAKYYLKEALTRLDAAAATCILSGVVICAIFGKSAPAGEPQTLDEIWQELSRNTVYAVSPLIFLLVVALLVFIRYSELRASSGHIRSRLECFARALLAGIFSGSTGFFAKAVVCSISDTVRRGSLSGSLGDLRFYVFIIGLPFSIFFQIKSLNDGLRAFDAVEIVPIYQACIVGVGVSWGWLFYEENKNLAKQDEYYFALGVLICVGGIAILSCKKPGSGKTANGSSENEPLLLFASPGGQTLVRQSLEPLTRGTSESPFASSTGLVPVSGSLFKGQSFYTPHLL